MKLASTDGKSVELIIDDYEFPSRSSSGKDDWDANWLMIRGEAYDGERRWRFRDPSLTTWSARDLAIWLRSIVDGTQIPNPVADDAFPSGLLHFDEPNIAFNLQHGSADGATIRAYLSLESSPTTTGLEERPDIFEFYVELSIPIGELAKSTDEWQRELREFPVR